MLQNKDVHQVIFTMLSPRDALMLAISNPVSYRYFRLIFYGAVDTYFIHSCTRTLKLCLLCRPSISALQDKFSQSLTQSTPNQMQHHKFIMRMLANGRVDPSVDDNRALKLALMCNQVEIANILLKDRRVLVCLNVNFEIIRAAERGYVEIVKILLQFNVYGMEDHNLALAWAARNGHTQTVQALLDDTRFSPGWCDGLAIKWATEHGHDTIAAMVKSAIIARTFVTICDGYFSEHK